MKLIAITMMISLLSACGGGLKDEKGEFNFFTVEEATIKRYVNDKPLPSDPDFTQDKTVLNRDYPIEIALYMMASGLMISLTLEKVRVHMNIRMAVFSFLLREASLICISILSPQIRMLKK